MLDSTSFRTYAHQLVDWMADYLESVEQYPVKSPAKPGEILSQLPAFPPTQSESMDQILDDFQSVVMPGITHWQHPQFYAYFQANSSFPSLLAEMLTATLGTQAMIWETSPAAAEMEIRMMDWLKELCDLPRDWAGCIQPGASEATLAAILSARERVSQFQINQHGFQGTDLKLRIYCSEQTHSSIEKAGRIAGIGSEGLAKIPVDGEYAMDPEALERQLIADKESGWIPTCVTACIGTTGSHAIDPLRKIAEICQKHGVWLHVDAAHAGSAAIVPAYREILDGLELADSYVFNPHKWMFTNFDCSAYFVKDPDALVNTFDIQPEYLRTRTQEVSNFKDWGVALGRRFRALKLWFVIRSYGVEGLQSAIRNHIEIAQQVAGWIDEHPEFERLAPTPLNLVSFRYHPQGTDDPAILNELNKRLNHSLNDTGKLYLTHTNLDGAYTLRLSIGQTNVTLQHLESAWALIQAHAKTTMFDLSE
ncbi:aminotransferase class I/II-fold pyridoxal phosphate-dependent enzyme [Pontibacter sp. G13]|uniref:pyridoxal phosphate-dependent decarboxylase family protein n=1 Tax=Pontibacter sp. G13 TaxID=3074898 RepID=UPI00288BFF3D|nr:aminotransferase class I/II-fold pyridoxal phosphate-dependent enzyme [Pontibacter sp. G13]WNJ18582.1 pyridoxal-dependent decarboxylase [Pontibacter sp. G13]